MILYRQCAFAILRALHPSSLGRHGLGIRCEHIHELFDPRYELRHAERFRDDVVLEREAYLSAFK